MSRDLRDLAVTALRGTTRAELPRGADTPLGHVLQGVQEDTPEGTLLARAALAALYTRAGRPLEAASAPPAPTVPPPARPLPESLETLLLQCAARSAALAELLFLDLAAREWTLSGYSALRLLGSQSALASGLWPLLDARGQSVLAEHPLHTRWQVAQAQAAWQARLDALLQSRQTDPQAGAEATLSLWKESKADQRRDLLGLLQRHLLPEDDALLTHAEADRVPEIALNMRQLRGHLPGPFQDALLALLRTAVQKGKTGKLTFKAFDLPEALGRVNESAYNDSDHHRLLGALPFGLILETLGTDAPTLLLAAQNRHWSLHRQLEAQHERHECAVVATAAPPQEASPADLSAEASALLQQIQRAGRTGPADERLRELALRLDPALSVSAPEPVAFEPPAPPRTLPRGLTAAEWLQRELDAHERYHADAGAAWRDLTETLRLRLEWAAALAQA